MTATRSADDRCVGNEWVMNTWIRHQIRLELIQIHIQRAIESQTASNRTNDLRNQPIQMLERRTWDIQVATADIVYSFVVD